MFSSGLEVLLFLVSIYGVRAKKPCAYSNQSNQLAFSSPDS